MRSRMLTILLLASAVVAQTGGGYDLRHSVIADGGGTSSAGSYSIVGTIGQPIAGTTSPNGQYALRGGFWFELPFAPTAAGVSISGRVRTAHGAGIRGAIVWLTSSSGASRNTITNSFGHFRFDSVTAGEAYILQVVARRHFFESPVQLVNVYDQVDGITFVSGPRP